MKGNDRSAKDKQRASYLKSIGEERTEGKCAICYKTISVDCPAKGTKYRHVCGMKGE